MIVLLVVRQTVFKLVQMATGIGADIVDMVELLAMQLRIQNEFS
jgi:hypothetical protein